MSNYREAVIDALNKLPVLSRVPAMADAAATMAVSAAEKILTTGIHFLCPNHYIPDAARGPAIVSRTSSCPSGRTKIRPSPFR